MLLIQTQNKVRKSALGLWLPRKWYQSWEWHSALGAAFWLKGWHLGNCGQKWNTVGRICPQSTSIASSPRNARPHRYLVSLNSSPQLITLCIKCSLGLFFLIPQGDRKINHCTIITFLFIYIIVLSEDLVCWFQEYNGYMFNIWVCINYQKKIFLDILQMTYFSYTLVINCTLGIAFHL